jgi:hypothetical protein
MVKSEAEVITGWWDVLFKINQVIIPVMMAWGIWVTTAVFEMKSFMNQGNRFTASDGMKLETDIKEWVRQNYPPQEMKLDIRNLQSQVRDLEISIKTLANIMKNDFK